MITSNLSDRFQQLLKSCRDRQSNIASDLRQAKCGEIKDHEAIKTIKARRAVNNQIQNRTYLAIHNRQLDETLYLELIALYQQS